MPSRTKIECGECDFVMTVPTRQILRRRELVCPDCESPIELGDEMARIPDDEDDDDDSYGAVEIGARR